MEKLKEYFNSNYKKYIKDENLTYTHLNTVLDYESVSILTIFNNHIMNNFDAFINKYINNIVKRKNYEEKINRLYDNKKDIKKIEK